MPSVSPVPNRYPSIVAAHLRHRGWVGEQVTRDLASKQGYACARARVHAHGRECCGAHQP